MQRWMLAAIPAILLATGGAVQPNVEQPGGAVQIRGTYGSPAGFWQTGAKLADYHINAVFLHHGGSDEEYTRALNEGALVFAEFGVFRDQELAAKRPDELWPIGADGQPVKPTERFLGLCPTNEPYNQAKLEELRELVRRRPQLAGVWLDYLHFHCDFELPDPPLTQTCFNQSCLARFERDTDIMPQGATPAEKAQWILKNHLDDWADWKCSVITDFARQARSVLDKPPGILMGIYSCPWTDDEYDGGMRQIVGEDITQLAPYIDAWSPMVYHGNCARDAGWAERYACWLRKRLDGAGSKGLIWPIVQGGGTPDHRPPVTPEGLETALRGAFRGGGTGVMFYYFGAVAEDSKKLAVLKQVYADLAEAAKAGTLR